MRPNGPLDFLLWLIALVAAAVVLIALVHQL